MPGPVKVKVITAFTVDELKKKIDGEYVYPESLSYTRKGQFIILARPPVPPRPKTPDPFPPR